MDLFFVGDAGSPLFFEYFARFLRCTRIRNESDYCFRLRISFIVIIVVFLLHYFPVALCAYRRQNYPEAQSLLEFVMSYQQFRNRSKVLLVWSACTCAHGHLMYFCVCELRLDCASKIPQLCTCICFRRRTLRPRKSMRDGHGANSFKTICFLWPTALSLSRLAYAGGRPQMCSL